MTGFHINGWDWPDEPRGPRTHPTKLRLLAGQFIGFFDWGGQPVSEILKAAADYIEQLEAGMAARRNEIRLQKLLEEEIRLTNRLMEERDRECVPLYSLMFGSPRMCRKTKLPMSRQGEYCCHCGGKVVVK